MSIPQQPSHSESAYSNSTFDSFNVAAERLTGRYGDKPFITWYDDHRDERVELSYKTFGNWVAKTANLLVDELGAGPGDRVGAVLADHWQTPIVLAACWRAGVSVVVLDPAAPDPAGDALTAGGDAATMAGLVERAAALAGRTGLGDTDRLLSGRSLLTVDGAVAGLLAPFLGGAGVVLTAGLDPARFWKRVTDERVTLAVLEPGQAAAVRDAGPPPPELDRSRLRVLLDD